MKRRQVRIAAVLATVIGAALLPRAAFACQITDPGCYIDDFTHRQLYELDLSIWQINRAGLVLARWLEDLRVWLTDSVFADAFTTLRQPVKVAFYLALILAWLVFIISFLLQSFVDLRWVDLRRATRPILLAVLIFTFGGSLLKASEQARLIGGTVLQQAASDAAHAADAPQVPTENTGDMADASSSIYASRSSCGTAARAQSAMFLNDYSARYLWSNAEDVHCAELRALAGEFYSHYFPNGSDISAQDANTRQNAVAAAAQGGMRQVTGVFMIAGAIVEQLVQLLFALALALVWFGILLSLVFAVFVPTEALFSSQITALLSVLRASWLASFLIGLGLAVLQIVAASGNGLLVFICGLVLIAVTIWQGKQALQTMSTALSAVSAATGSAPQAVGGMIKGWGMTAALVGGVALTGGGLGAALGSVGSSMVRRAGRSAGDNPVSEAAGRVLANRVADRLDSYTQDQRMEQDANLSAAEAAWYERGEYAEAGMPAADADARQQAAAARQRGREQQARVLERQAERARQARNFAKADQLRREASNIRGGPAQPPALDAATLDPEVDPTELDRAMEQLHEAHDDPETQRRVLAETAALALRRAQLRAMRKLTLRDKRVDDAKAAIGELHVMLDEPAEQPTAIPLAPRRRRLRIVHAPSRLAKILPPILEPDRDSQGSDKIGITNNPDAKDDPNLIRFNPDAVPSQEVAAGYLPAASEAEQDVRLRYDPARGMSVNGIPVLDLRYSDGGRTAVRSTAHRTIRIENTWGGDLIRANGRRQQGRIAQRADLLASSAMTDTDNVLAATNSQPANVPSSQTEQVQGVPRAARTTAAQEARPSAAPVANTVAPVNAPTLRSGHSSEQTSVAQAVVAATPVPTLAPGTPETALANVAQPVPVPATPMVAAPTPVMEAGGAADTPAAAPVGAPAAMPVPSPSTPATSVAPASVQPAPPASNGLPLNAAATSAPAVNIVAPAGPPVAADERQPARATTGAVLPAVAEVRERANGADSRPESPPAAPATKVASPRTATSPRQPWKRRTRGNQ